MPRTSLLSHTNKTLRIRNPVKLRQVAHEVRVVLGGDELIVGVAALPDFLFSFEPFSKARQGVGSRKAEGEGKKRRYSLHEEAFCAVVGPEGEDFAFAVAEMLVMYQ